MLAELWLSAVLIAAFWLVWLEVREWWRPRPRRRLPALRMRIPIPGMPRGRHLTLLQAAVLGAAVLLATYLFTTTLVIGLITGTATAVVAALSIPVWSRRRYVEQVRNELKVALDQLAVSLRSGRSLPTALQEWPRELAATLGQGKWVLLPEIRRVQEEMTRGATPEEGLMALAERVDLEELHILARVVTLCRRRGSDLGEVVSEAAQMLAEALAVRSQMSALTAGKRAEGALLTFLPPVMVLLTNLASPDYMGPMVQSNLGRLMLVIAAAMVAASFVLGRWLLDTDL